MTKLGIMSFAHMHAMSYATSINAAPDAELTAIWDSSPKRGRDMAKQYSTRFIKDMDGFLDSDVDGVIVCSENIEHRPMVEAAAAAGKWVLCEKPLATTPKDAKAMITACRKAKVGLGTAFPCRFSQPLIEVKRMFDRGELGEVYAMACTNNGSYPGGWFAEDEKSGGGATMDHTVHVADVLRWFTGQEFSKVYAEVGRYIHRKINTDDMGVLHLEMESGVKVSHIASWNRAESFPTWGDVTLQIVAEKGVLDVDAFNQKLNVYSDAAQKAEWATWGSNADSGLIRDFVDSIREQRNPLANGVDGLRAVEVTAAAYQSAASGRQAPVKRLAIPS